VWFREHQDNINGIFATPKRLFATCCLKKTAFCKIGKLLVFAFNFFNLGLLKHFFPLFQKHLHPFTALQISFK
jgi:hypothetical protein